MSITYETISQGEDGPTSIYLVFLRGRLVWGVWGCVFEHDWSSRDGRITSRIKKVGVE
jgi:hypothetical protein